MTQPRSVLPGSTYLLTRRVLRRHFLLRPDPDINNLIVYALAVSAQRHGILVHVLCAMSTHLHLVVTDPRGVLPRFLQHFHRTIALGTKVLRAWEGPVWDHEPTSAVLLTTPEAVVDKIAYTLANPVAAGLVRRARDWPGATVLVDDLGHGMLRAARPRVYIDPANPQWPAEATLKLSLPPMLDTRSAAEIRHEVASKVADEEAKIRLTTHDKDVLGADSAASISPYERAMSMTPPRAPNPTFAVGRGNGDGWRRAAAAVRAFRAAYRASLAQWREGVRTIIFPAGTWWMRMLHAVSVSDVPIMA